MSDRGWSMFCILVELVDLFYRFWVSSTPVLCMLGVGSYVFSLYLVLATLAFA